MIDSIIAVWLLGLGEFDLDNSYSEGPDKFMCWFMFCFATFLILVVFMNMLIAIMGQTYSDVQDESLESGLLEQLNMIMDSVWLLDLGEQFKHHKYIIVARPDSAYIAEDQSNDIEEMKNELS